MFFEEFQDWTNESLELMKDNVWTALFLWTKVSYVINFKYLSLSIFKNMWKKSYPPSKVAVQALSHAITFSLENMTFIN